MNRLPFQVPFVPRQLTFDSSDASKDQVYKGFLEKEKALFARWASEEHDPYVPEQGTEEDLWGTLIDREKTGQGPLAATKNPPKLHRAMLTKAEVLRQTMKAIPPALPPGRFRMPQYGEPVRLAGLDGRRDLNGRYGEVLSSGLDEQGFVTVSLFKGESKRVGGRTMPPEQGLVMKVRPHRLQPLQPSRRSESMPALRNVEGGANECATDIEARTCTNVSSVHSRRSHGGAASQASRASERTAASGSVGPLSMSWYNQGGARNLSHYPSKSIL